jgi:hypothetical protein
MKIQLVSAGVPLELIYTNTTPEGREKIKSQAEKHLTNNRNLQRTMAMFERLDGRFT